MEKSQLCNSQVINCALCERTPAEESFREQQVITCSYVIVLLLFLESRAANGVN